MWDMIVSVPDHCLSFYFAEILCHLSPLKMIIFALSSPRNFQKVDRYDHHDVETSIRCDLILNVRKNSPVLC